MKSFIVFFVFSILSLTACQSTPPPQRSLTPTGSMVETTPTPELTEIPVRLQFTATEPVPSITAPNPTPLATTSQPTETQISACATISYAEYAQFEIIAPSEVRIMIDVHDPTKLSRQVDDSDLLLTTHTHWDHLNEEFQTSFPGKQLFVQSGELEDEDVRIQGIASAHNQEDQFEPKGGTNYIYLVDINGLRIAHFGDIGQTAFTEQQLAILDEVDIAITQINNPYSDMNAENQKGINLIQQLRPKLVIPTHMNLDTVKLAVSEWESYYTDSSMLRICEEDLSYGAIEFLLLGDSVATMRRYVELGQWDEK